MTTPLETELRTTLSRCATLMPSDAAMRLSKLDYRQPTRRFRRRSRIWSIASASGGVVAGCAAAVILLFSTSASPLGVPMAYAGWAATPKPAAPAALARAVAACNRIDSWNHYAGTPKLSGDPVLTDARGDYVAAIYASGAQVNACISDGHDTGSQTGGGTLSLYALPTANQLGLPLGGGGSAEGFPGGNPSAQLPKSVITALRSNPDLKHNPKLLAKIETARRHALDQGVEEHLMGRAGRDITAVTFVFANNRTVTATVQNGWYFAWWPNINRPSSVRVTSESGAKVTSQMNCKAGTNSCVFAGINPHAVPPKGTNTTTRRSPSDTATRTTPSAGTR